MKFPSSTDFILPLCILLDISFNSFLAINASNSEYSSSNSSVRSYVFLGVIILVLLSLNVSNMIPWSFMSPRPSLSKSITKTASYLFSSTSFRSSSILGLCIILSPETNSSFISITSKFCSLASFSRVDLCLLKVSNSPCFSASSSARDFLKYMATLIISNHTPYALLYSKSIEFKI